MHVGWRLCGLTLCGLQGVLFGACGLIASEVVGMVQRLCAFEDGECVWPMVHGNLVWNSPVVRSAREPHGEPMREPRERLIERPGASERGAGLGRRRRARGRDGVAQQEDGSLFSAARCGTGGIAIGEGACRPSTWPRHH